VKCKSFPTTKSLIRHRPLLAVYCQLIIREKMVHESYDKYIQNLPTSATVTTGKSGISALVNSARYYISLLNAGQHTTNKANV
jgi:hypothetical protein